MSHLAQGASQEAPCRVFAPQRGMSTCIADAGSTLGCSLRFFIFSLPPPCLVAGIYLAGHHGLTTVHSDLLNPDALMRCTAQVAQQRNLLRQTLM